MEPMKMVRQIWNYLEAARQRNEIDTALVYMNEIFGQQWNIGSIDSAEQNVSMKGGFDKYKIILIVAYNVHTQHVNLTLGTWEKIRSFVEKEQPVDFYTNRATQRGQIGVELLLIASKLSANDWYQRAFPGEKASTEDERAQERERHFDENIVDLLDGLESPSFQFWRSPNTPGVDAVALKAFLTHEYIRTAIIKTVDQFVKPNCTFSMGGVNMDSSLDNMKKEIERAQVYTTPKLNDLHGAVLRDGFLICTAELCYAPGDQRHTAHLYTVAIHELAHYMVRVNFDNYGWSTPTSFLPTATNVPTSRPDPIVPEAFLEMGRAVEVKIFGEQINWRKSTEDAAQFFVNAMADPNSPLPLFGDQAQRKRRGFVDRTANERSFSFAGEKKIWRPKY